MNVSIIIPHYNRSNLVCSTLQSVIRQSWSDWECIVVDDGSEDKQYDEIKAFETIDGRIQVLQRPRTLGKGANSCRNYGAEKSTGQYLIFLDSDDLLDPRCLEKRANCASEFTGYDWYLFPMQRFETAPKDTQEIVNKYTDVNDPELLLKYFLLFRLPWPITSVFWKSSFFKTICFDENLSRFQDYDIHILGLLKNPKICFYPYAEPDCYYRNSSFHDHMSEEGMEQIIGDGFYLIAKLSRRLKAFQRKYLVGFLLFLATKYYKAIGLKRQFDFLKVYRSLVPSLYSNGNALINILITNKYYGGLLGIKYLRQRTLYFAKESLLNQKGDL